jgi:hypothetical protein
MFDLLMLLIVCVTVNIGIKCFLHDVLSEKNLNRMTLFKIIIPTNKSKFNGKVSPIYEFVRVGKYYIGYGIKKFELCLDSVDPYKIKTILFAITPIFNIDILRYQYHEKGCYMLFDESLSFDKILSEIESVGLATIYENHVNKINEEQLLREHESNILKGRVAMVNKEFTDNYVE